MIIKPEILPFGEFAFLLNWSQKIDEQIHKSVVVTNRLINDHFFEFIIETTPAYNSIALYLKDDIDVRDFVEKLYSLIDKLPEKDVVDNGNIFEIPVCYDLKFGIDLEELSTHHKLSIKAIIAHHTAPIYPVYFIGFLPGFPYLEGLNPILSTPRKTRPRNVIPAGSVGIAGNQTGVYTIDSPGGWNIIGRSPINFFDNNAEQPSLLKAGDYVKFFSVDKARFQSIQEQVKENTYIIKPKKGW
ncbi:MAG: 5-oxoprolinase subunit PxpB [Brumimicrobium sp.]